MSAPSCPRCLNEPLAQRGGPGGIETDECARCSGVWLDKSEVYHYAKDPQRLFSVLAEAYKTPSPSRYLCRRCDTQMLEVSFPQGPTVDVCRKCGGTWFDKGELVALLLSAGA